MSFILSEYIKSFFFVFVVYYFTMLFLWFFLVYLRWVFIISLFAVGSEEVAVGDIIIFKNIAFFRNCLSCLFWAFLIERLCGLFVMVGLWLILRLIDEMVFHVCLLCFVLNVLLIEWLCGMFFLIVWCDWLFRLVVFCWTVVILWERRKIKVWRCVAMLPLLNSMSKWVRFDSSGWSFDLGVYCLLWTRFPSCF